MDSIKTLQEIISQRKSSFPKDYTDKDIPLEIIEEILKFAVLAPNHKRTKPWRFKIFKGEEKKKLGEELQHLYKKRTPESNFLQKKYDDIGEKVNQTNAIISIVCSHSTLVPEWEEIATVSMAVQNLYLLCTAYGIGCYWSTPSWTTDLGEFLQTSEYQKCLGLFYMGYI